MFVKAIETLFHKSIFQTNYTKCLFIKKAITDSFQEGSKVKKYKVVVFILAAATTRGGQLLCNL